MEADIKLLIFDLDGTLIDSKIDISNAINKTLIRSELTPIDPDKIWGYLGDGARYLVDRCFASHGVKTPDDATAFFINDYKSSCLENTFTYTGIRKLLGNLVKFKKAVLSNKLHEITFSICKELGIDPFFDLILGRSDELKKKPSPAGIIRILEKLKIKASQALIIGDTKIDLEAGKRAGIKRVAVTWGVHSKTELIEGKPDYLVHSVSELSELLDS